MPRFLLLVVLLAAGCTAAVTPSASEDADGIAGGTLRAGIWTQDADEEWRRRLLDPQAFWWHPLFRCCLLRTLLSYPGLPIAEGGAEVQPDLAAAMPDVSADGLTWTFRLREGLTYAPPFEDRAIVAQDFITALERAIRIGEVPYYEDIEGVQAYRDEEAGTISGVEAPDASTLVFRLTGPSGDFGHRVAMPFLAPMPAEALAVHDEDYAGYVVASGPYMFEGAEGIDHADPGAPPSWGSRPLGEFTMVRNPSWSPDTDPLRPAYVDRIEVVPFIDRSDGIDAVRTSEIDLMLDLLWGDERSEVVEDPALRSRVREAPLPNLFFIPLNVAQPPFDDVAVRRAVNLIIDRRALASTFSQERGSAIVPTTHAFPEVAVAGLLRGYEPFATPDDSGDVRRAREAMATSAYDSDGDGRCDGDACAIIANRYGPTTDSAIAIVEANLAELGIEISWVDEPFIDDPTAHVGLAAILGWNSDYPSANDFVGLFSDPSLGGGDWSLVGATPEQLAEWGYGVDEVPSLDDRITACQSRSGSAAFACWAEVDQLLTEQVVAWAPIARSSGAWLISERIDRFEIAGAQADPALDRISFLPEASR